ncbi:hypothetical protein BKA56DRAFT_120572 [Ilyonectria sp. MPI-CAGE-AT-0026]|nr:hypothetical protein BKA56DRAFT_120572 [Ilyonectria sp. MPI-CAGE-AT-0026]
MGDRSSKGTSQETSQQQLRETGQSQGVENRPLESPGVASVGIPSSRGGSPAEMRRCMCSVQGRTSMVWSLRCVLGMAFRHRTFFFLVRLFFRVGLLWHRLGPDGCVWPVDGWVERGMSSPGLGAVVPKSGPHVEALKVSLTGSKPRNPRSSRQSQSQSSRYYVDIQNSGFRKRVLTRVFGATTTTRHAMLRNQNPRAGTKLTSRFFRAQLVDRRRWRACF